LFKYIAFIFLIAQLHALPFKSNFQIGLEYDANTTEIKASPFTNFEVKTIPFQEVEQKIVQIKSFEALLDTLNIEKTSSVLKYKKIKKLLSNTNINDYTLTYLIYNRVTNFKSSLITNEDSNATYIDTIDIGGEFIALIHIKTNSVNEYEKLKKMKFSWKDIDKFEKELDKHSESITFKNIITADETIFPANNLKTLIQNAKNFSKDIKNHEVPYKVHLKNDTNKTVIKPYLKALQTANNLKFIRRNPEQFSKSEDIATDSKNISKYITNITKQKIKTLEQVLQKINYPKRYNAYTDDICTTIPILHLASKKIEKKYPKILENAILSVNYDFKIQIQNNGKIILLTWIKTVKESDKLIHKEKNSKIIFDSYINFKGLKASHIKGNSIGTISFNTKFDSYEKNRCLQGQGIIESADCGYQITDKNGTLEIGCNNIKLKKLEIKFEHED
jgi:hypothetical protein